MAARFAAQSDHLLSICGDGSGLQRMVSPWFTHFARLFWVFFKGKLSDLEPEMGANVPSHILVPVRCPSPPFLLSPCLLPGFQQHHQAFP